jgi:hypothetical protein
MKTADSPGVAEKLIEAATAASPRRRYTCGKVARQVIPERMFDKSLRKLMGLPGQSVPLASFAPLPNDSPQSSLVLFALHLLERLPRVAEGVDAGRDAAIDSDL